MGFMGKKIEVSGLRAIAPGLIAAALTFVVFLPSLGCDFIGWDDDFIYNNTLIRSLDLEFFKWVFTTPVSNNWHPLTFITFALDYAVWGLDPTGYHLTNIIFHSLNALLVFLLTLSLVRIYFKGREGAPGPNAAAGAAFVSALVFALHPLRVESVVWVSERKDVLCAFFYFLALIFYLRHISALSRGAFAYLLALASFILALLSKPMAITLPAVLLLLDYCLVRGSFGRGRAVKTLAAKLPFFALSLASVPVTLWAQADMIKPVEVVSIASRFFVAARGFVYYPYKTLYPAGLVPFNPIPASVDMLSLEYGGSALLFVLLSAFFLWALRRYRWAGAAWLFYVVTLAPVAGIVQVGLQAVADRYTYIPVVGLTIPASVLAAYAFGSLRTPGRVLMSAAGLVIAAALVTLTVMQTGYWKNSETLLTRQIDVLPAPLAYFNRGIVYSNAGEIEKAIGDFTRAVRLDPDYVNAYVERGRLHEASGDLASAIRDFSRVAELVPDNPSLRYYLGLLYARAGMEEEARARMSEAARMGYAPAQEYLSQKGAGR